MKSKTQKIKKPEFDADGYQIGRPHIQGESLDFEKMALASFPSVEELAGKSAQTKITLAVDLDALDFFKKEARRLGTSYQRMMRNLLSSYARQRH